MMLFRQLMTKLQLLVALLLTVDSASVLIHSEQLDELWINFKTTYNKVYSDQREDGYRRQVWAANVEYISLHNIQTDLGQHSFTLGLNEYSDLTRDEYRKYLLGSRLDINDLLNDTQLSTVENLKYTYSDLPDAVNWTTKGYVTPVKNQGQCGSCWAFSATGALEGQNFKKAGRLVSLSEQNLVDCSKSYGNEGCNGGWNYLAMLYVAKNGGIDTEQAYPYEAKDDVCRFSRSTIGATCLDYAQVIPRADESALAAAVVSVGPISVCIDAGHQSFHSYRQGVYYEPHCSSTPDHCVLVAGYGTYQGQDYWLIKNSWGTSWGVNGYMMLARNRKNQCGIASYAFYPVM
jgi:cathepsin L